MRAATHTLTHQPLFLWVLLPAFCRARTDVSVALKADDLKFTHRIESEQED